MTTTTRHVIHTPDAPKAVGLYSQGIAANGLVFVAGQTGINPKNRHLTEGAEAQNRQAMNNNRNPFGNERRQDEFMNKGDNTLWK